MKRVFLSMKCCAMWNHWVFWSVIHKRHAHIPFHTLHYCWEKGLWTAEYIQWTGILGVSNPTSCLDQLQWEQAVQSLAQPIFIISKDRDATTPLGNLFQCSTMTYIFPYIEPEFLVWQLESIVSHPAWSQDWTIASLIPLNSFEQF